MTAFLLAAWLAASKASHARFSFADRSLCDDLFRVPIARPPHSYSPSSVCVSGLRVGRRDGALVSRGMEMVEVKRKCSWCGLDYAGALHGRYCSQSCKQKAYRDRKRHGGTGPKKTELRTCARCGIQFEGALHGRYHSKACKQAAYRERQKRKFYQ